MEGGRGLERRRPGVGGLDGMPGHLEQRAHGLGGVLAVVHHQDAQGLGGGAGGDPRRLLVRRRGSSRRGKRITNSLPFAQPLAVRLDRAAVQLDQLRESVRPIPRPSRERSSERSPWMKRSKMRGSSSGGCRPRCRSPAAPSRGRAPRR